PLSVRRQRHSISARATPSVPAAGWKQRRQNRPVTPPPVLAGSPGASRQVPPTKNLPRADCAQKLNARAVGFVPTIGRTPSAAVERYRSPFLLRTICPKSPAPTR